MKFRSLILSAVLAGLWLLPQAHAESRAPASTSFTLSSHRGQEWSLEDAASAKAIVVAFLGTECPLAKLYGPRLSELQAEYKDRGVTFVGINANAQDSPTEITAWVARHKITFPVLKDPGNRVADQYGAERTPEVFLLDSQRRVCYRGRIDDQYSVGRSRDRVRRRDLAVAIDQLLAGEDVAVSRTEAIGCHIGRVNSVKPKGDITWSRHIAPIFNQKCVECHRENQIAPFALTRYEEIIGWEETILEVIEDNRMPPWFANPDHGTFRNDARLSKQEKELIAKWVENGMPEGDRSELPDSPEFAEGWRMQDPDQIIYVRLDPFEIPANGVVDYQYFEVDPKWTEDKYIIASEARPDNLAVVHHIIAYAVPPGKDGRKAKNRKAIVGYAPGATPNILDEGTAMHVPAGSKIIFEMHYTPNGSQQTDLSYIGVKFTEKKNVRKLLRGVLAINTKFQIPPGAENEIVEADYHSKRDEMLLEMTPHMHLRGKSFRYDAFYPDGTHEILLDVPNYDFNWQLSYILDKPKLLPKGTRIHCTATFDNSENNLVNPDPTKTVRWGDQSSEEMMIGFLNVVDPDDEVRTAKVND